MSLSFFAKSAVKLHGSHVVKSFNSGFDQKFKWEANVSPSSMPLGENMIKAWLYEPKNKQFVMLGNEQKIRVFGLFSILYKRTAVLGMRERGDVFLNTYKNLTYLNIVG